MKIKSTNIVFSGQSMLEVLVALSAAVIIITSITAAVITSLSNTQYSKNQNAASRFAQEGLDIARQIRDTDYGIFRELVDAGGVYCLAEGAGTITSEDRDTCDRPNVDATFIRTIEFKNASDPDNSCNSDNKELELTEVSSKMAWTDSKCDVSNPYCHEVRLVSCLSDVSVAPEL